MLAIKNQYYVPVFANWEGEILPAKLTNGTVAFYNPSFFPADVQTKPKLNATVPAFWMAIQAVTPLIHKNEYFVVLGERNTIVEEVVREAPAAAILSLQDKSAFPKVPVSLNFTSLQDKSAFPKVPVSFNFTVLYFMFGLGMFLFMVQKKQ